MIKRFCVFIIALFLLLGCTSAYAATRDDAQIFADQYVTGSNTYLSSTGNAQLFINLRYEADIVFVSSCTLQTKENGRWITEGSLAVPQEIGSDTASFFAVYDYSSYLSKSKTYRIIVTFNIDGYIKSCTSNSITY